jgi:hypothetical protein
VDTGTTGNTTAITTATSVTTGGTTGEHSVDEKDDVARGDPPSPESPSDRSHNGTSDVVDHDDVKLKPAVANSTTTGVDGASGDLTLNSTTPATTVRVIMFVHIHACLRDCCIIAAVKHKLWSFRICSHTLDLRCYGRI